MPAKSVGEITIKITEHLERVKSGILWYIKQLLPLTYWSLFTLQVVEDDKQGFKYVCVWKMWLGYSYGIRTWKVDKEVEHMTDNEIEQNKNQNIRSRTT